MDKISEKELDQAMEGAFKTSPQFVRWFLSKTKFADQDAKYYWSRSNHPWGRFPIIVRHSETGTEQEVIKEGETDVLVVFEVESGTAAARSA